MKRILSILMLLTVILSGCKKEENTNDNPDSNIQSPNVFNSEELSSKVKEIITMLPSPGETMLIIKHADPEFSYAFLNPVQNMDNYDLSDKVAVNLGVYISDLSYLIIGEQNQKSLDYVVATKKLAEKLGLLNFINDSTINEIQDNLDNRDKVINKVTEIYLDINNHLTEENRNYIASLIILGAWTEGVYIAINLTDNNWEENQKLAEVIADQYLTYQDLDTLLNFFNKNDKMKKYYKKYNELNEFYKKYQQNPNQENFNQFKNKLFEFRNQLVSI